MNKRRFKWLVTILAVTLLCVYFPCRCHQKKWNVFRVCCDVWWVCISTKWSRKEGSIKSQLWCDSDRARSHGETTRGLGPSAMPGFRAPEMRFSLNAQYKNIKLTHIHRDGGGVIQHWNKHKHFIFLGGDEWPLMVECRVWRRWHLTGEHSTRQLQGLTKLDRGNYVCAG